MEGDAMSNAKDAVATMGAILPDDAGGRDAVHVACFAGRSDKKVFPGQDVGLVPSTAGTVSALNDYEVSTGTTELIGIVDPFLKTAVQPRERFWVFLYPRTITGLSHRWTHPAFEKTDGVYATPASKVTSEEWIKNFCERENLDYETTIALIQGEADRSEGWLSADGDYIIYKGTSVHGEIPDEFWVHAENVLGSKIKERPKYFSCSC